MRPYRIQVCGIANLTPQAKRTDRQQQSIKKLVNEHVRIYGEEDAVFEQTSQVDEDGSAKFDSESEKTVGRYWVKTKTKGDHGKSEHHQPSSERQPLTRSRGRPVRFIARAFVPARPAILTPFTECQPPIGSPLSTGPRTCRIPGVRCGRS